MRGIEQTCWEICTRVPGVVAVGVVDVAAGFVLGAYAAESDEASLRELLDGACEELVYGRRTTRPPPVSDVFEAATKQSDVPLATHFAPLAPSDRLFVVLICEPGDTADRIAHLDRILRAA
jgi:hypothetical protein